MTLLERYTKRLLILRKMAKKNGIEDFFEDENNLTMVAEILDELDELCRKFYETSYSDDFNGKRFLQDVILAVLSSINNPDSELMKDIFKKKIIDGYKVKD